MAVQGTCSGAPRDPAPGWMIVVSFGVLVLLALVLVWQVAMHRPPITRVDAFTQPAKKQLAGGDLVYVHKQGCGWCTRFAPVWREFTHEYDAVLWDAHGVRVADFEAADPRAAQFLPYVEAYPTVLFREAPGGAATLFEGPRTVEGLARFAEAQVGASLAPKGGGPPREPFVDQPKPEPKRMATGFDALSRSVQATAKDNSLTDAAKARAHAETGSIELGKQKTPGALGKA